MDDKAEAGGEERDPASSEAPPPGRDEAVAAAPAGEPPAAPAEEPDTAGGEEPDAAPDAPAAAEPPGRDAADSRAPGVGAAVAWSVAVVALLVVAVFATAPYWGPLVAEHAPALKAPFQDPRVATIEGRVSTALQDLESERARFNERIAALMKRLDALEETSQSLRRMVQATVPRSDAPEAEAALRELGTRLAEIESTGQSFGSLAERVSKLEAADGGAQAADVEALEKRGAALNSRVAEIAGRIESLERSYQTRASARGAEAAALAVGQLREALRSPAPFARELALARGLIGVDAGLKEAFDALAPHADKGLPTLEALRQRFDVVAEEMAQRSVRLPGDGFIERTVNKLTALVTVRRVDAAAAGADDAGAIVARAEADLAKGELEAAIGRLAGLKGEAAALAAPWLAAARARLAAEQALAMLHVHAISLVGQER